MIRLTIEVPNPGSPEAVSIPSPVDAGEGSEVIVKDMSGTGSTNNIVVTPESGEIDGAADFTIDTDWGWAIFKSDGIEWLVISSAVAAPPTPEYQIVQYPPGTPLAAEGALSFASPLVATDNPGSSRTDVTFDTATLKYQTVQRPAGTPLTQRAALAFSTEFSATDNSGSDRTEIALASPLKYQVVQNPAGTPLTARAALAFSSDFTVTDNSGSDRTEVALTASAAAQPVQYSIVDMANQSWITMTNAGDNFSTGTWWMCHKAMTCTGVRFYWKRNAADKTINCKIWSIDSPTTGTALATKAKAVTSTGIYTAVFDTPVSLAAFSRFCVSIRESGGNESIEGIHGGSNALSFGLMTPTGPLGPKLVGPYLVLLASDRQATGDVFPQVQVNSDIFYPVEPVLNTVTLT